MIKAGVIKTMVETRETLQRELNEDPRFRELRDLAAALSVVDRYANGQGMVLSATRLRRHGEAERKVKQLAAGMGVKGAPKLNADYKRQRDARLAGKRPIDWLRTVLNGEPIPKADLAAMMVKNKKLIYKGPPLRVLMMAILALQKSKFVRETPAGFVRMGE